MTMSFKYSIGLVAALTATTGALGQAYPNKPVKVIVGYAAGGAPDSAARILNNKLGELLNQSFVVENKPGASATLATTFVAKAAPDGYNLLLGDTAQLVIAPHIFKGLPYDTNKDLTPVSRFYISGGILIVANAKSGIRTVQDLVREAKANPGKLSYGSSGIGSTHHIFMEVFKAAEGLDLVHIPYKGTGQSTTAILSGEVPVLLSSMPSMAPHLKAGKLHLLAVASKSRLPSHPDVPSLSETIKDFDFSTDFGILGPAGLSPDIVGRLSRTIRQATESRDFVDRFKESGATIEYASQQEYADSIRQKLQRYQQAVRRANIEPTSVAQ